MVTETIKANAGAIPVAYLLALATAESSLNPKAKNGTAVGLFQITVTVAQEYAKAKGLPRVDRADPTTNTKIAVWHLGRILKNLSAHAKVNVNWLDLGHAAIVALAYTAGWSETQGVPFLISRLRGEGRAVTVGNIIAIAQRLFPKSSIYNSGGGYMSSPLVATYVTNVTSHYARSLAGPLPVAAPSMHAPPQLQAPAPAPAVVRKESSILGPLIVSCLALGGIGWVATRSKGGK